MRKQITKMVAHNQFKRLCDALGKRVATDYKDVGAWRLDFISQYGGYSIEEIISETGAISHPFGHERLSGSEFYNFVNFSLRAIQLDRLNGAESSQYWPSDKIQLEVAA